MKLSELKRIIDLYYRPDHPEDPTVVIQIKLPYNTVGPMPTVPVENVMMGIDWDSGKFILQPTEELTPSDRDFVKKMQETQTKVGDQYWAPLASVKSNWTPNKDVNSLFYREYDAKNPCRFENFRVWS